LIGALTALFAASIAFAQNDIKKVLAYSTVSQLGYMFMGVGVGAFSAGVFHVFTHAFFKACLFLCAGAVIHALHDEQDIRQMGGLRSRLKVTHLTFLVSTLAIAGIAPLSGFFSKDEILWKSLTMGNPAFGPTWLPALLYVIGIAAALCTAFYMFRLYALTFLGPCRLTAEQQRHIHVPGQAMRVPLLVLAFFAAVVGPLALPGLLGDVNVFHHWLDPTVSVGARVAAGVAGHAPVAENALAHNHPLELGLLLLSLVVAVVSSALAYRLYRAGPSAWAARFSERFGGLYRASLNKLWVDELYNLLIIRPFKAIAWVLFKVTDKGLIDIVCVHGAAWVVDVLGRVMRRLQSGNLQQYVAALVIAVALVVWWVSEPPSDFTITPEGPVTIEQAVVFDATPAVTSARRKLEYRWDFDGDGTWDHPPEGSDSWSTSAVVRHRFAKPSTYRVVLRVRDPRWQTWTDEVRTIEVLPTRISAKSAVGQREGGR
jgi:NADH-quinone oxidoreductase subunit L